MRRADIESALVNVEAAIDNSRIFEIVRAAIMQSEERNPEAQGAIIVAAMQKYISASTLFRDAERTLTSIFNLEILNESEFWAALLREGARSSPGHMLFTRIQSFKEIVPSIIRLLRPSSLPERSADRSTPEMLLSVIVIEDAERRSTPHRLSIVLESVADLYGVCAATNNLPDNDLAVVACDSGSDKSFDFLGAAKAIQALKELILSLWDRIVFFRERKIESQLDLLTKALPIMERIAEMQKAGTLEPEQAEIYRKRVSRSAVAFVDAGALIPEISVSAAELNPRQLLAPSPKLLTGPTITPDHGSLASAGRADLSQGHATESLGPDDFTQDEIRSLRSILKRRRPRKPKLR